MNKVVPFFFIQMCITKEIRFYISAERLSNFNSEMRETTITKLINHLQEVLKQNISLNAYAEQVGLPQNYFWVKKQVDKQRYS